MQALQIHAGPTALKHLREHGLQPEHVRMIPGAAGGPKGLALNPLDRFLFGHWLPRSDHVVHLAGASIGAWRLATACMPDPDAALAQMAHNYIHETYADAPDGALTPGHISNVFDRQLIADFGGREHHVLAHPRYRLHVFTSRGVHPLLHQERARLRTALGYLGAFTANLLSRRAMSNWLERVVFSDPRDPLPLPGQDYRTHRVALDEVNLRPAILASCSIPFWLRAVQDIPGAPPGAYWDGGITDYHLHLEYASLPTQPQQGPLVLYPHFQSTIIPGWLDKGLRRRHRATPALSNVVLLSPNPEWIRSLPNGKLPDRKDFKAYGADHAGRIANWTRAVRESQRLADEFEAITAKGGVVQALPLA
jgi:hypothetical protein